MVQLENKVFSYSGDSDYPKKRKFMYVTRASRPVFLAPVTAAHKLRPHT